MSDLLSVTDALGRKIAYRILDPGDTMDLLEAAGASAQAQGFMQYAMIVASAASIDDVPVPRIMTRDGLRQAGKQLKNEGVIALSKVLFEDASAGGDVEAAKNLADTP